MMNHIEVVGFKFWIAVIAIFAFVAFNAEGWKAEADQAMCGGECINIAEELEDSITIIKSLDN